VDAIGRKKIKPRFETDGEVSRVRHAMGEGVELKLFEFHACFVLGAGQMVVLHDGTAAELFEPRIHAFSILQSAQVHQTAVYMIEYVLRGLEEDS